MRSCAKQSVATGYGSLSICPRDAGLRLCSIRRTLLGELMDTCGLVSLRPPSAAQHWGEHFRPRVGIPGKRCLAGGPADPNSDPQCCGASLANGPHQGASLRMKQKSLERFNWENTVSKTEAYEAILS